MAEDIVAGLFGLTPFQVQQQQNQALEAGASQFAQLDPFSRANYMMYKGGAGLANIGAGMLGMQNTAVAEAQRRQAELQGLDISSPESILAKAATVQDPQLKMRLMMLADQKKKEAQALALQHAQQLAAERRANAEASPIAKIDPTKVTQESLKLYVAGGMKDPSVLVPIEKPQYENRSNEEKLVEAAADAKGLKPGTPERAKFVSDAYQKLMDKKTHISVNAGVSGGQEPTKEEVDYYAQMALSGDQSWRIGLGRSKDGAALIRAVDRRMPEIAKEVGMSPSDVVASKQEVATRAKALRDFSTGVQGRAVNSFNTAIDHLGTLEELGNALKNKDLQVINRAANLVSTWTGQPAPVEFNSAKQIVGQEIVKAIVANGGGVTERQEAARAISDANSPEQLVGVIKTYKKLMAGQLKSLELQYEQNTKRKDFKDKLTAEAKNTLGSIGESAPKSLVSQIPGGATAPSKQPTVSNW